MFGQKKNKPELSDIEIKEIAKNRQLVHEYLPELIPFIDELYKKGVIDGWRAVKNVQIKELDNKDA